jgi:hypothetical protein
MIGIANVSGYEELFPCSKASTKYNIEAAKKFIQVKTQYR